MQAPTSHDLRVLSKVWLDPFLLIPLQPAGLQPPRSTRSPISRGPPCNPSPSGPAPHHITIQTFLTSTPGAYVACTDSISPAGSEKKHTGGHFMYKVGL